jgi:hypothetical protein
VRCLQDKIHSQKSEYEELSNRCNRQQSGASESIKYYQDKVVAHEEEMRKMHLDMVYLLRSKEDADQ